MRWGECDEEGVRGQKYYHGDEQLGSYLLTSSNDNKIQCLHLSRYVHRPVNLNADQGSDEVAEERKMKAGPDDLEQHLPYLIKYLQVTYPIYVLCRVLIGGGWRMSAGRGHLRTIMASYSSLFCFR